MLADGQIPPRSECERLLRDSGFSRKQAKALLAEGYAGLSPEAAEAEALLSSIARLAETIKGV